MAERIYMCNAVGIWPVTSVSEQSVQVLAVEEPSTIFFFAEEMKMPDKKKCPYYDTCTFETDDEEAMAWHVNQMDIRGLHEAQVSDNPKPFCIGCIRTPDEIEEYLPRNTDSKLSPDDYVKREEGTYNPENGHFLCTVCYINAGSPSSPSGWKAP